MYSIQYLEADRWQILDGDHHAVFVGTKRQVEDWLDFQDNVGCESTPQMSLEGLVQSLRQVIHRLAGRLSRPAHSRIGHTATSWHATKR